MDSSCSSGIDPLWMDAQISRPSGFSHSLTAVGMYGWGLPARPVSSLKLRGGSSTILILPASDSLTPFMRWYVCEPDSTMRPFLSDWSTTHLMGEKSSGTRWTSSMISGRSLDSKNREASCFASR